MLHPLPDRPLSRGRLRGIRAQLGSGDPALRVDLVGYFAPHEGSATTAYGVYHVENLADYEAYRARLRADPLGQENYAFAKRERFILKEDRMFLRLASSPIPVRP